MPDDTVLRGRVDAGRALSIAVTDLELDRDPALDVSLYVSLSPPLPFSVYMVSTRLRQEKWTQDCWSGTQLPTTAEAREGISGPAGVIFHLQDTPIIVVGSCLRFQLVKVIMLLAPVAST